MRLCGTRRVIRRALDHVRRVRNAHRFGIAFKRRRGFTAPRSLRLDGRWIDLRFPEELEIHGNFLECFVNDYYGLSHFGRAPGTILDIGANVGFFALAARGYFPAATIHCYEPNPRVLNFLEHQSREGRFICYPQAVGASAGRVKMIDDGDSNSATARDSAEGPIERIALSQAIGRLGGAVDLAKINCEGGEWALFEARDCWKHISSLRVEYHLLGRRESHAEVRSIVSGLGFEVARQFDHDEIGLIWARRPASSRAG